MCKDKIFLKGRLYDGGNERLRYSIELPYIEGCEEINCFFEKLSEECETFCRGKLFDSVRDKRERYHYALAFCVTHSDGELLSVVFRAKLSREGENICIRFFTTNWSLFDCKMIPAKMLLKKFGEKKRKKDSEKYVFLQNGVLKSLRNAQELNFC